MPLIRVYHFDNHGCRLTDDAHSSENTSWLVEVDFSKLWFSPNGSLPTCTVVRRGRQRCIQNDDDDDDDENKDDEEEEDADPDEG